MFFCLLAVGCSDPGIDLPPPSEHDPWVLRTDFSDDSAWSRVRELIAKPELEGGMKFQAYVRFVSEPDYQGMSAEKIVHSLPDDYPGHFLFVVDKATLSADDYPVLVIYFGPDSIDIKDHERAPKDVPLSEIQHFRALPHTIRVIENNLSIANMDWEDFESSLDATGVFRGFNRSP